MHWKTYGPNSLLITFADHVGDEAFMTARAIAADLAGRPPRGLREFVPAFTTVLLDFDPALRADLGALAPELVARFESLTPAGLPPAPLKEIPVRYTGEDIEAVARSHDLTTREVRDLHSAPIYKVYLLGFSPGFPYLGELDQRLHTPRLSTPRTRVPPGAVAIGGEHTGIYSVDSPGGWNVIGYTRTAMFDPARGGDQAFHLHAGDKVKFVPE